MWQIYIYIYIIYLLRCVYSKNVYVYKYLIKSKIIYKIFKNITTEDNYKISHWDDNEKLMYPVYLNIDTNELDYNFYHEILNSLKSKLDKNEN